MISHVAYVTLCSNAVYKCISIFSTGFVHKGRSLISSICAAYSLSWHKWKDIFFEWCCFFFNLWILILNTQQKVTVYEKELKPLWCFQPRYTTWDSKHRDLDFWRMTNVQKTDSKYVELNVRMQYKKCSFDNRHDLGDKLKLIQF